MPATNVSTNSQPVFIYLNSSGTTIADSWSVLIPRWSVGRRKGKGISLESRHPYSSDLTFPLARQGGHQCSLQLDLTCDLYPLRLDRLRQCEIRSLSNTSAHEQHWELNSKPSDFDYNALSAWPCANNCRICCCVQWDSSCSRGY